MNQNTVTGDYININLRQLGATSIKEFNSIMHIAEFDLGDGLIVSYVFNITRHNKYFLQRMQPYAMVHGKFASDQEIIDFITADLKRFENAKNSHNFNTFLLISHLGHHITENMDKLQQDFIDWIKHKIENGELVGKKLAGKNVEYEEDFTELAYYLFKKRIEEIR